MLASKGAHTLALLAAGLVLGGCAGGAGGAADFRPATPAESESVMVEVTNDNWLDMGIYAVQAGARRRLGTVESAATRDFTLPRSFVTGAGGFRLMAEPIGSREVYTSEPIMAEAGSHVEWSLRGNLDLSSYRVTPLSLRRR